MNKIMQSGTTLHGRMGRQSQLSLLKSIKITWRSIRVRFWRSLLVTSGVVLALAFLVYVLCSEALRQNIVASAPATMIENMQRGGLVVVANQDAVIQTRWMVGLALLVGFVGVLNAMLLSVTERFREIGTMKCLGALDSLVVRLFLLESVSQGVIGSLLGISIGLALTLIEGRGDYGAVIWQFIPVARWFQMTAFCFVAGVGLTIIGALYPARLAARMVPVDAMRSEV
jgi:predicted lysophospholipase L1 biosynthesis ABC-type transport system permease subunit